MSRDVVPKHGYYKPALIGSIFFPALQGDSWGNTQSTVSPLCQESTGPYLDYPAHLYTSRRCR